MFPILQKKHTKPAFTFQNSVYLGERSTTKKKIIYDIFLAHKAINSVVAIHFELNGFHQRHLLKQKHTDPKFNKQIKFINKILIF